VVVGRWFVLHGNTVDAAVVGIGVVVSSISCTVVGISVVVVVEGDVIETVADGDVDGMVSFLSDTDTFFCGAGVVISADTVLPVVVGD